MIKFTQEFSGQNHWKWCNSKFQGSEKSWFKTINITKTIRQTFQIKTTDNWGKHYQIHLYAKVKPSEEKICRKCNWTEEDFTG